MNHTPEEIENLFEKYGLLSDEELLKLIREGDDLAEDVLYTRYKPMVRGKARPYFLVGADREDIIQEGMIGLYRAVCDYGFERQVSFHSFAEMCITRQIITAVKRATRKKHGPLNNYVSLSHPVYEEGGESERTLSEILCSGENGDPEESLIGRENMEALFQNMEKTLSSFEKEVLSFYLQGESYQQIALKLDRSAKSIDNAIQRVKKKLESFLN